MTKPTKPAGFALSNPVPQTKWEAQREKEAKPAKTVWAGLKAA